MAGRLRADRASATTFVVALWVALALTLAFLLLPLAAIFLRIPPGELVSRLASEPARDAILVTLRTNLVAQALILLVGTPASFLVATRSFRGRSLLVTLIELPLVLPPAVAGVGLIAAFGRFGLLGSTLDVLGLDIAFTQAAVVMAVAFVASPFYLRQAIAAFEAVEPDLPAAARTLGAGPARTFLRVWLPLAATGLGAGAALAFARGIGEFGATIMFAGSLQGVTQTMSLAVYEQFDVDFDVALSIGALLIVVSAAVLLTAKMVPLWLRSRSTSTTASVPTLSR